MADDKDDKSHAPDGVLDGEKPKAKLARRSLASRAAKRLRKYTSEGAIDADVVPLRQRISEKAKGVLKRIPVEDALDQAFKVVSDPKYAQTIQTAVRTVGSAGMKAGFKREPRARLLFDFGEWCTERSDRGHVMAIILADATEPGGGMYAFVQPVAGVADRGIDPVATLLTAPVTSSVIAAVEEGRHGLMFTLVKLAALGCDVDTPSRDADTHALARWFKASEIPDEFKVLADFVFGNYAAPSITSEGDASETPAVAQTTRDLVVAHVKSALPARSLPSGARFLLGTYPVFVQNYLGRNLVDSLPTVMEKMHAEVHEASSPAANAARDKSEVIDVAEDLVEASDESGTDDQLESGPIDSGHHSSSSSGASDASNS